MDEQFRNDPRYVSMQIQTVSRDLDRNTFESGLADLKKHGVNAWYGFDAGEDGTHSLLIWRYAITVVPWTLLIDSNGTVILSGPTNSADIASGLDAAIRKALAAAPKAADGDGDGDGDGGDGGDGDGDGTEEEDEEEDGQDGE